MSLNEEERTLLVHKELERAHDTVTEQDILEGIEIAANFIAAIETLTNQ
jgi:hypothetical protein